MAKAFSRLQLAAALIEYDNDDDNPSAPRRVAQESAIFTPFRKTTYPRPPAESRRSTDYLGVALPTETASIAPRESLAWDRKSRASIDALQNPFGRDSTYDGYDGALDAEEDEEEDMEVDLASWGLDALVPKEKEKEKGSKNKRKNAKVDLPNPYDQNAPVRETPVRETPRPHARTSSMNMLQSMGGAQEPPSSEDILGPRRHSFSSPLDYANFKASKDFLPRRPASGHPLIDNLMTADPQSIPFPSSESIRSPSPSADRAFGGRARSASIGSRAFLDEPNPFAVRPPSPDRASRFDPKSAHGRTYSTATMTGPQQENPFAVRPPSPGRSSRFDPKVARGRTMSHGTMATMAMLDDNDDDDDDAMSLRERRYSRMELMRPKVLIMPSPLQNVANKVPEAPSFRTKEGFELDTTGPPLPPGARAARRSSTTLSMLDPSTSTPGGGGLLASNSFTPNPRSTLTLSQLTFRNTLMVDGQRDVSYADIDGRLRRATEDGEQIEPEPEPPEPEPVPVVEVDEGNRVKRPAGKLYGKSLIDDLEARKVAMKGKSRTFMGDQRPSMMARTQTRSSTFINPDDLKQRPTADRMGSSNSAPGLARRNSANGQTLLNFEDEGGKLGLPAAGGNTKSVFGVDTLWEREVAKLKGIEAQEAEERRRREEAEEARNRKKKGKKKGKGKEPEPTPDPSPAPPSPSQPPEREASPESPQYRLPEIPKTITRRPPPPPADDDSDSETDSDDDAPARKPAAQATGWHSDEEETGPKRTTGTGPRYPVGASAPRLPQIAGADDDSSEEDVPLVATIGRAAERQARSRLLGGGGGDSSDEEQPLSVLLDKTKQKFPAGSLASSRSARRDEDEDDEDNEPLGLRASRIPPSFVGEDDDDKPLGLHPDQMRKSQFYMAQQQQQQQQQMMMQAQMAQMQMAQMNQSMIFGGGPPSLMGSGYFGAPMMGPAPMMMYPPQLPPTPPPMQDATKFVRVDQWRQEVAIEEERR